LNVSSRATAHVPNLLFVTAAVYAFSRFLATERPRYLYLAGASVGLAFYCKESTALLLPVFALTLLVSKHRQWLLKPQIYLACAAYVLVISPDIVWNMRAIPDDRDLQRSHRRTSHVCRALASHRRARSLAVPLDVLSSRRR
jgi:4-amino-4-deoxy-L-arabinose transferase-like glycosyltransferase